MKKVQPREVLPAISPDQYLPTQRIYAFKGRSGGREIYILSQMPLVDYDENGSSLWCWKTLHPIGGYCGTFKSPKAAFEQAFVEMVDIFEFESKAEFFNWAINND